MSDKKHTETNPGVGCDVTNCKYNTIDCRCNVFKDKRAEREPARRGRDLLLDLLPERRRLRLKRGRRFASRHEALRRAA